jgi:hypothetical protein
VLFVIDLACLISIDSPTYLLLTLPVIESLFLPVIPQQLKYYVLYYCIFRGCSNMRHLVKASVIETNSTITKIIKIEEKNLQWNLLLHYYILLLEINEVKCQP